MASLSPEGRPALSLLAVPLVKTVPCAGEGRCRGVREGGPVGGRARECLGRDGGDGDLRERARFRAVRCVVAVVARSVMSGAIGGHWAHGPL